MSSDDHYQTFPIVLAPYFGQMIAEHLFKMWDGMRQSGVLARTDTFTIGEFGAGDGALAESIVEYIQAAQADGKRAGWAEFARQAVYVCYDRSPALNRIQRGRNKRFGSRSTRVSRMPPQLYDVERSAANGSPDARYALRQTTHGRCGPRSTTSGRVLAQTVLPKSPVGDGLRYLGNHWAALQRYIEDGRLAIDNNRAENQLRVVAVGRKNWLFAGSFDGAVAPRSFTRSSRAASSPTSRPSAP